MENIQIVKSAISEDELAAKRRDLAQTAELLAEGEMELTALKSSLARFQYRYFRTIGRKYVELDELLARLAGRRAERAPGDERIVHEARYRRFEADRSARAYRESRADEPAEPKKAVSSEQAKKLYREIAIQIHPDRAENETTRIVRTVLMAELNAAYAANELERMRAILEEWRSSPEAVTGSNAIAELQRLVRKIARLKHRFEWIERETDQLRESSMGRLMRQVREATVDGRDLLGELAAEIELKIALVRRELEMEELLKKHEHHR